MPTVISKYLNETASKYNISKETCSKGLVLAAVVLYGCKLSYPLVQNLCNRSNKLAINCSGKGIAINAPSDSEDEKSAPTNNNKLVVPNGNIGNGKCYEGKAKVKTKRAAPGFNKEFILELYKLVRLMIPGVNTPEVALLILHTLTLITRTFMSIYVATMEGQMVKYIVRRDVKNFAFMLLKWLGVALPATFLNSMIRYLENKLALAFR